MGRLQANYEDHYEVCYLLGRCCLALLHEGSQQCRDCFGSRLEELGREYQDFMGEEMVALQKVLSIFNSSFT